MISGAMSSVRLGPQCFIKSKINTDYQDILKHLRFQTADKLYGHADFILQPDLDSRTHSAKTSTNWFGDHNIAVLDGQAARLNLSTEKTNLDFNNALALPQTDCLHAMHTDAVIQ